MGAEGLHDRASKLEQSVRDDVEVGIADGGGAAARLVEVINSIRHWLDVKDSGEVDETVAHVVTSELDLEKAMQVVTSMRSLLEDYNGDAVDLLDELESALAGTPIASKLPAMRKHLDGYDFDAALSLLEEIHSSLS